MSAQVTATGTEGRGKMGGGGGYAHKGHRKMQETPGPSVSAETALGAALGNSSLDLNIPDLDCKIACVDFNPGVGERMQVGKGLKVSVVLSCFST